MDTSKRFYVVDQENIVPINEYEKEALAIFLLSSILSTREQFVTVSDGTEYIFKKDYYVSFKKRENADWSHIVVSTEKVFEAFTKGEVCFRNPLCLHGMLSLPIERSVPRSISTYGFKEHQPSIECFDCYTNVSFGKSLEYIITSIDSIVPNIKPAFKLKDNSEENIYLHVTPVDGLEYNEEIYWFIDYKNMCVCQYEDGYPIRDIGKIVAIK